MLTLREFITGALIARDVFMNQSEKRAYSALLFDYRRGPDATAQFCSCMWTAEGQGLLGTSLVLILTVSSLIDIDLDNT